MPYVDRGYWDSGYAEGDSVPVAGAPSRSTRRRKRISVEIDDKVYDVASETEALALLEQVKAHAQAKIDLAKSRAANALRRPARKILRDAEKLLTAPVITSDDIEFDLQTITNDIAEMYRTALQDIEIAVLMRRAEIEQDDEEVLLLAASL